jgi:hypothetical protein
VRRRGFLLAAGAAPLLRPAAAAAQAGREAGVLTDLLRVEHTSVFAYDHVLAKKGTDPSLARLARTLRGHEAEHAEALASALSAMHWPLPGPPEDIEQVEIPQIRVALEGDDPLAALLEVERLSEQVLRLALGRLREGRHIQLAATILATEATHLVALRAVR